MRGKDRTFLPLCRKVGITPAYAGKSDRDFVAVHKFLGSPPPMRGKAAMLSGDTTVTGITPAYAGKSSSWSTAPSWTRDHPRLCGEKKRQAETEVLQPGSPPPMRGKAVVVSCNGESYGITPAYAGKRVYAMIAQDRV